MTLLVEDFPHRRILRLRLNRPDARNALSLELRLALAERFAAADRDENIKAVIIAGSEKVFAAGADIKAIMNLRPTEVEKLGFHRLWQGIADFRKPLIAAVRGFALGGGCELALHADMIVAGRSATFGLPEVKLGIMPGAGGTQRLVRAIGKYRAMRMLMTGEFIKAPLANEWGMISHLVDDTEVEEFAVDLASTLAAGPALALEYIKEMVLNGADLPLSAGLALERKSLYVLFDTADQKEGMRAFTEARKAEFG